MEGVYSNLNKINSKDDKNKQRIDEMHRREEMLQEEVDAWRDRPCNSNHIINNDNRETINFRNYKRNPIEFLKRVEELIAKNRETRWTTVSWMRCLRKPMIIGGPPQDQKSRVYRSSRRSTGQNRPKIWFETT